MTRTLPTDAQPTLTAAEVKHLLREIAFVLRLSQGIKMEIVAGARPAPRPAVPAADDTVLVACPA